MKDITYKGTTKRVATARAELTASPETLARVRVGDIPKGDPLPVAKVAAIMAAKKTTEWIPYCHNIPIEHVGVEFDIRDDRIIVDVTVSTIAKTGVEMEAITAAAAAVITLYDMLKMIDDDMEIESVRLLSKIGGKSDWGKATGWTAAIIVASDRASKGEYEDQSGEVLRAGLLANGAVQVSKTIVADEIDAIRSAVQSHVEARVDFIFVTGGTGIGPRDLTPEAINPLITTPMPGVVNALQTYSQDRIPTAMLSRPVAGIAQSSMVLAIPGSPGACADALAALFPTILHARSILMGGGHD